MPLTEIPDIAIPEEGAQHDVREVRREHDDYPRLAQGYEFLRDSYTGGGGYATYKGGFDSNGVRLTDLPLKTYLQKYHSEPDEKWQRRLAGAYYPNWIRRIVAIYAGLLTRESPKPDKYPEDVESWQGEGDTGWNLERAQMIPWLLVYPTAYVLTDAPQQSGDVVSAAQADDSTPYAKLIHPDRVLDWDIDKDGDLTFFKYASDISRRVVPEGKSLPEVEDGLRYTIFTPEGWWYYDVWDEAKSGTVPVMASGFWPDSVAGTLPVAVYHSGLTGDSEEDISPIEYLARVMMRLYNVLSQKAATEDGSCFPLFMIPTKGDAQKRTWGDSAAITYPFDAKHTPSFAGYDVAPVEHMTNEAERLINQLKDLASIAFGGDDAGDTGIAKAYAFMLTDVTLAQLVSAIEDLELQVMNMIAKWLGNADGLPDGATPGFPRTFDLVGTREEIDNATKLLEMELGPIASTEIKKRSTYKYLTDTDPETGIAIEEEFDAMAEEEQTGADGLEDEEAALELARAQAAQPLQAPVIEPR